VIQLAFPLPIPDVSLSLEGYLSRPSSELIARNGYDWLSRTSHLYLGLKRSRVQFADPASQRLWDHWAPSFVEPDGDPSLAQMLFLVGCPTCRTCPSAQPFSRPAGAFFSRS
jgi:hypothetical protein